MNHGSKRTGKTVVWRLLLVALLSMSGAVGAASDLKTEKPASSSPLGPFLKKYCLRCHGEASQKGDRRFDGLEGHATAEEEGELLQEILDQLNLGDMPPRQATRPTAQEVREVVAWLTHETARARQARRVQERGVVFRRLNRAEYFNTVRDLFGLDMADFDPTEGFDEDESADGFDNIGEALVSSDALVSHYLEAARRVVDKGVRPGPRPIVRRWSATGAQIHGKAHPDERGFVRALVRDRFHQVQVGKRFRGVPEDGQYVIRVKANTVRWKGHRFNVAELGYDPDEKPRIRIVITSRAVGSIATRVLGEYEVSEDVPGVVEVRTYLQRGLSFAVEWANGPRGSQKRILRKVLPKYHPDALALARNPVEMYMGAAPELRLYSIEIEGPHYPEWPPPGFMRFFGDAPASPDVAYLETSLVRFASYAFRRPAVAEDIGPYLRLARVRFSESADFWEAAKLGLRALMTSPQFLHLVERAGESAGAAGALRLGISSARLDDFELATRLSYFLWSSMPDDTLFELARTRQLSRPAVLQAQVDRMLSDPKARALCENFLSRWLELRSLGTMPPDPAAHRSYYRDDLESAMRRETRLLFEHLLKQNGSILDFLASDYTFLNAALAKHYGIDGVEGEEFRRVTLKPEHRRGGLLGHGSVLTLTSNGVETQPVRRGVWVLENLLGTPPAPPPPDVQPVEPDTRGVRTIRQLMEKHRSNPTCHECHRKIDPIGLGLENFDAVGRYRTRYAKRSPIDASGELPDGSRFEGAHGIKRYLLARPKQFSRNLTEKMLTYALGRLLSFTDRADVDEIVAALERQGYGLRDLVQLVVASEVFRTR